MKRLALAVLGLAPALLLVAFFFDGAAALATAALAAASLPPAAILLAAGERDRWTRSAALVLWLLLAGAWAGALALAAGGPRPAAAHGYPAGLPWASWLLVVGVALLPLVLLAAAHALCYRPPSVERR